CRCCCRRCYLRHCCYGIRAGAVYHCCCRYRCYGHWCWCLCCSWGHFHYCQLLGRHAGRHVVSYLLFPISTLLCSPLLPLSLLSCSRCCRRCCHRWCRAHHKYTDLIRVETESDKDL